MKKAGSEANLVSDFVDLLQSSVWISSPEFAGWLEKKSSNWIVNHSVLLRNTSMLWTSKWVALHGTELVYMDKEPTLENLTDINIRRARITSSAIIEDFDKDGTDNCGFSIQPDGNKEMVWQFRAFTEEEKANWLVKLSQVHAIAIWLDTYERIRVIGSGAQGIVYELRHRKTGQSYALKEIEINNDTQMRHAVRESLLLKEITENISHPNIMRIEKVFQVGKKFYLVFPLCTGGELYEAVVKRGFYTEYHAARIIRDVVSALQTLHQNNILHLDMKPENILFETNKRDAKIKITDFGLAKTLAHGGPPIQQQTAQEKLKENVPPSKTVLREAMEGFFATGMINSNNIRGSYGYMSPELILTGFSSTSSDVFATGVILYILLCGYPPFYSKSNRQLFMQTVKGIYRLEGKDWDVISPEAKDLVKKMLAVFPQDRISTEEILKHPWIKKMEEKEADKEFQKQEASKSAKTAGVDSDASKLSLDPIALNLNHAGTKDNLAGPLGQLANHIRVLKAAKIAKTVTRLIDGAKQNRKSKLAQTYLGFPGTNVTPVVDGIEEGEEGDGEGWEFSAHEIRAAITSKLFALFGADETGKMSVDQFIVMMVRFGFKPNLDGKPRVENSVSVLPAKGDKQVLSSIGLGGLLLCRFIDRDNDGYITADDVLHTQIQVLQRSDEFLAVIFRFYQEALWYPGKHMNLRKAVAQMQSKYLKEQQGQAPGTSFRREKSGSQDVLINEGFDHRVSDETTSSTDQQQQAPFPPLQKEYSFGSVSAPLSVPTESSDKVDPPRTITVKHVAAVFAQFGFDPKVGARVYEVLCQALSRIAFDLHTNHGSNGSSGMMASGSASPTTPSMAKKGFEDLELRRSESEEAGKEGVDTEMKEITFKKLPKMDLQDFVRACQLDDILVQVIFSKLWRVTKAFIQRAGEKYMSRQQPGNDQTSSQMPDSPAPVSPEAQAQPDLAWLREELDAVT